MIMKKYLFALVTVVALSAMSSCCCPSGKQKCQNCSETNCSKECCESGNCTEAAPSSVLVVVDVQRDFFCPEGSLYVKGSEVLPAKIAAIAESYDAIIFTLDWHPADHCSFADNGGTWPAHCVAFTQGAGLADEFKPILAKCNVQLFLKGCDKDKEQYGAFEDVDGVVACWLKNADKIDVCGIAGDYCVKESTANILKIAPAEKVTMLLDCIASIDDGTALADFIKENSLK